MSKADTQDKPSQKRTRSDNLNKKASAIETAFATVPEAAAFLHLSRSMIYKMMDDQTLEYKQFGTARRIPWRALHALEAQ